MELGKGSERDGVWKGIPGEGIGVENETHWIGRGTFSILNSSI